MKMQMDEPMKKKIWMYACVACIAIVLFFAFYKFSALKAFIKSIIGLISPFILGFGIAFLLNKPMMMIETKLLGNWNIKQGHKRTISAVSSIVLAIAAVSLFFYLLIPQLLDNITSLVDAFPGYLEDFQKFVDQIIIENNLDLEEIQKFFGGEDLIHRLTQLVTEALPQMAKTIYSLMNMLLNLLLGIMSALYMMMDKEKLCRHVKISAYALLPKQAADYSMHIFQVASDVFNNFIIGKAIDSLIIGVLCYIGMTILQLPYELLLSVIVGVTNMIPVFGPFIGAVPGVFILLIIHPTYAIYFALFILLLQQFDGNILGPLILGDKLGLPSLWILFAVCVGGGLFGVLGMFIGVPVFAVVYTLLKEFIAYRLKKKELTLLSFDE